METQIKFDDFIKNLRPDQSEKENISGFLNIIANELKALEVIADAEVAISGPFKRETMLRNKYEADLVVIIDRKKIRRKELLNSIENGLRTKHENLKRIGNRKFVLVISNEELERPLKIEILPTFKVNSPRQMKEVRKAENYYGYMSRFHTQYINKHKPLFPRLIDFILLMKRWSKVNEVPLYPFQIELLCTVVVNETPEFSWESYVSGFLKLLKNMLDGEIIFPMQWEKRYKKEEITATKSTRTGILMIDPGNPANNLGGGISEENAEKLRSIADYSIESAIEHNWNKLFKTNAFA